MGHIDSFEIFLDNELAIYHEGDHVTGKVKIVNAEVIKYKLIRVELSGVAILSWASLDDKESTAGQEDVKGDICKEQYFEKIVLLEKEGNFLGKDPILISGEHEFTFEFKLPPELPSSFDGQFGQLRYEARAIIERSTFKSSIVCRKAFTVLSGLDLNFIPEAAAKIEICKYKELGLCCTDGSVTIDWVVDKSGFVAGDDINIHGSIQNDSKQTVTGSSVTLYMIQLIRALLKQVVDYKSKKRRRRERRKIVSIEKGETVTDEVTVWNETLHIPPCPTSGIGRCKLIDASYELEFKVTLEGNHSPIICVKEVHIGTVAVCMKEMKSCVAALYNQPFHKSPSDDLTFDPIMSGILTSSHVSLTDVIAAAINGSPHSTVNATAPTLDRNADLTAAMLLLDLDVQPVDSRPPPYAPGHVEARPESPSAPSAQTLMRPWTECTSGYNPLYCVNRMAGSDVLDEEHEIREAIESSLDIPPDVVDTRAEPLNNAGDSKVEEIEVHLEGVPREEFQTEFQTEHVVVAEVESHETAPD